MQTAEKFGLNEQPSIPGAAESTIPPGDQIGDDLAVGSTAIGQGMVLATALQMASVGATIANNGVRAHPTLLRGQFPRVTRVTSRRVARTIRGLMIEVVRSGTGVKAALPGRHRGRQDRDRRAGRRRPAPTRTRTTATPGSPASHRPAIRAWRSGCSS